MTRKLLQWLQEAAESGEIAVEDGLDRVAERATERLGRAGAAWLGPVSEADVIITGRDAPTPIVWDLSETGVKVTLV